MSTTKTNSFHALPDLRNLGYSMRCHRRLYQVTSPVPYFSRRPMEYFVMDTPDGVRKVKVHSRSHLNGRRYMHGIAWPLFDEVDDFVLWHEGERFLFIVPASLLKKKWIECGHPRTGTQWIINLCAVNGRVINPSFYIHEYAHHIPSEPEMGTLPRLEDSSITTRKDQS